MGVTQLVIMPMFFISGALFPVTDLPGWLAFLNRIDPLTYAVAPMRSLVFNDIGLSSAANQALNPPITWFGWAVPTAVEIATVFGLGLLMLGIAIWEFNAGE
jgi:ABC-2 type transport system permease protein